MKVIIRHGIYILNHDAETIFKIDGNKHGFYTRFGKWNCNLYLSSYFNALWFNNHRLFTWNTSKPTD